MKIDFESHLKNTHEIGFVENVVSPVVYVRGLPGARLEEVIVFENGGIGEVTALGESLVEILSISNTELRTGLRAARTQGYMQIPVGDELLGSVINPLGESLNQARPLSGIRKTMSVNTIPLGIGNRARVSRQCFTGVAITDLLLPVGKGQRTLVIGDQKTGKSWLLMRSVLSQVEEGSVGIYAVIGKNSTATKEIQRTLIRMGIAKNVVLVVSGPNDSAGMRLLTPYAAMAIAEHFRDEGRDVFLVLDDLTTHAKIYREVALLARRYPGRNAYPGDIFHMQARLLERAGNFMIKGREVAITCLPVAETVGGDLTSYIPNNLMSMTDGHLLFDRGRFQEGRRPAIDPFLSVTRVGLQTQSPVRFEAGRKLLSFLRSVQTLHSFSGFGAEMGEHIKRSLAKEDRILQFLDDTSYSGIAPNLQMLLFGIAWGDQWKEKQLSEVKSGFEKLIALYQKDSGFRSEVDQRMARINSLADCISVSANLSTRISV